MVGEFRQSKSVIEKVRRVRNSPGRKMAPAPGKRVGGIEAATRRRIGGSGRKSALRAFSGSAKVKESYLAQLDAGMDAQRESRVHERDDPFTRRCVLSGCPIYGRDYKTGERELGIPAGLLELEDLIWHNLAEDEAKTWPEIFARAIPAGRDLSPVSAELMHWLLLGTDEVTYFARAKTSRKLAGGLYERVCRGGAVRRREWREAAQAIGTRIRGANWFERPYEEAAHAAARGSAWKTVRYFAKCAERRSYLWPFTNGRWIALWKTRRTNVEKFYSRVAKKLLRLMAAERLYRPNYPMLYAQRKRRAWVVLKKLKASLAD